MCMLQHLVIWSLHKEVTLPPTDLSVTLLWLFTLPYLDIFCNLLYYLQTFDLCSFLDHLLSRLTTFLWIDQAVQSFRGLWTTISVEFIWRISHYDKFLQLLCSGLRWENHCTCRHMHIIPSIRVCYNLSLLHNTTSKLVWNNPSNSFSLKKRKYANSVKAVCILSSLGNF